MSPTLHLEALEGRLLLSGSPLSKAAAVADQQRCQTTHVETNSSHNHQSTLGNFLSKFLVGDSCQCEVNKPPVAVADQGTTLAGKAVSINVLSNDKDPEGGPLTLVCVGAATSGAVALDPAKPGVVTYTPKADFTSDDCFTYTVRDNGGKTAQATVKVKVSAPPAATPSSIANKSPIAVDDKITAHAGKAVWCSVLANDKDADGDALTLVSVTQPAKGTVRINSGKVVYTPREAFLGTDKYTYTVSDPKGATATATVVIEFGNRPPVATGDFATTPVNQAVTVDVTANDKDADGDVLKVTSFTTTTARGGVIKRDATNPNKLVYTPPKGATGEDCFTYTVSDGLGGSSEACVKLVIAPPPCPTQPITVADKKGSWFGLDLALGCFGISVRL